MSNVYVHFSQISFPARYSVVNFQLESHSLRFREVIIKWIPKTRQATSCPRPEATAAPLMLDRQADDLDRQIQKLRQIKGMVQARSTQTKGEWPQGPGRYPFRNFPLKIYF